MSTQGFTLSPTASNISMPGTYHQLIYHIVFSTKARTPWLSAVWTPNLYSYIGGIIRHERGVLLSAGGIEDHIHLLISYRPDASLSNLMREIKSRSSRWVSEEQNLPEFAWQEGYAAFSVSTSQIDTLRSYIACQQEHHQAFDFKQELLKLLNAHNTPHDERYVF